jgi:iron-sulfur cluster assembly protein
MSTIEHQPIDKTMTISNILSLFPQRSQQLAQLITKAGLHCVGCGAAVWETLEGGMIGHGKDEHQIDQLVQQLNDLLRKPLDVSTISLTQKAAEQFKEVAKEENKEGWGLRFGDKAGGCNGFEYIIDFSEKPLDDDQIFESFGVQIHINEFSAQRLMGCEIDYVDGLYGAGFKIANPNSKTSCGCGSSHNY